jgi:hypothetical protein
MRHNTVTIPFQDNDEGDWEIEAVVNWGRRATRDDPSEPEEVEFVSVTAVDDGDDPLVYTWDEFVVVQDLDQAIIDSLEAAAIEAAADIDADED